MEARSFRTTLLWLSAVRGIIAVLAIPLAPFLYREHFLVLVLMRPTKEVLLAGGFLAAKGDVHLLQIAGAAIPLAIVGVWHAFALGRLHHSEIRSGELPWLANRVLRPEKVRRIQKVLRKRGDSLVFLGRLAAFPSTLLGVAAGASKMPWRRFLVVDAFGGLLSIALVLALGYALGGSGSRDATIATAAGVVMLVAFSIVLGVSLRREPKAAARTPRRRRTSRSRTPAARRTARRRTRAAARR